MEVLQSHYQSISEDPGVYVFLDETGEVLYVGKAKNLKRRISSYFQNKDLGEKTAILVSKIQKVKTIRVDSEIESLLLEANLIKKYNPRYNARLTDGKAYLLARITVKDKSPKVLTARQAHDKRSLYFGPFPSSSDLKIVLKLIRRIFPHQSITNHPKRYCLYYHLGLCPCPPMFKSPRQLADYRKNIRYIVNFFEGKTKKVLKGLESERDSASKREDFEKALDIQRKIDAILAITSPKRSPFEYEQNLNLRADIRNEEIKELINILNANGVKVSILGSIECYDISNISGIHAVGSMVVFTDGEKNSSEYRRFKIKRPPKTIPNDYAMLQEVIRRRFSHPGWGTPNLIIVDGGKGQISSVNKTLFEQNIEVPVIGIAKREELIITSDFKTIKLPRNSNALNLVRRIRDEAHRFAITYHRKLRSRFTFG